MNDHASPSIEAIGVSRAFGGTPVVRDATLRVNAGEVTALVGPNGSGKTTLMLMLATLLRPDNGSIRIGGHDTLSDTVAARSALGWMPDTLGAWNTLTVRETLTAVCAMYGIAGRAATTRVDTLLDSTALRPLEAQRSHTLSRGQKQRLSLARALVHQPRVLLLDEPASGLDPEARLTQRRALEQLASEGTAILITSHVLDELEQLASSVVFLREGRTEADATVAHALRQGVQWRVRAGNTELLRSVLLSFGIAAVSQRSLSGEFLHLDIADEASAAHLLRSLITAGVDVIEFAPATGSLEQAFVHLSRPETPPVQPSTTDVGSAS